MSAGNIPQRRSSPFRSLGYLINRWILRRPFLVANLTELGLRFRVKTEDVVGRHIYKYHVHEAQLSKFLVTHLDVKPGDVIIDIGANIGWYSVLLERMSPSGVDLFSFEPDPLNFELLIDNLEMNDSAKVRPVQKALAAEAGVMQLYQHDQNNLGRHSLLALQDGPTVDVETTTLDAFWAEQNLGERTPRFIKIDIEGYELHALRGAASVLARCPTVLCEFSPEYMRQGGIEPADLIDLMTGHGFEAHLITPNGLEPIAAEAAARIEPITDLLWQKPAE